MQDPRHRDSVDEELEFHLALRAEELRRRGMGPDEARRRALSSFGDLDDTRRYCRRQSRRAWWRNRRRQMFEEVVRDVKSAFRQITRNPVTAATIVLTLALGIGANSAIYSLVEAALLRAAPVREPDSLVAMWTTCRNGRPRCSSSYLDILDYGDRSSTLVDLAAYGSTTAALGEETGSRVVSVQMPTGNYFDLLGVRPAVGRLLNRADDIPGGTAVTVLSNDLWRSGYGADPEVVGRTLRLNGRPFEVVGVAAPGFEGLHVGVGPDLYVPLLVGPELAVGFVEDDSRFADRGSRWIDQLVGRRAPDATVDQVRAEMSAISDLMAAENPDARGPRGITVDGAHRLILPAGNEETFSRFLVVLLTVVGLTLLLACANLANLQIARASSRGQEIAIRAAIGADRGRLARQVLTESLVLGLLGGVAGLALCPLLLHGLSGFNLPGGIEIAGLEAGLDLRVLAFTFVLAVGTGVLFGIGPAITSGNLTAVGLLSGGTRSGAPAQRWVRSGLVAIQVALSLVLLFGATLFIQALRTGRDLDIGLDRGDELVLATIDLGLTSYGPSDADSLLEALEQRMLAGPGVTAFAAATRVPLMDGGAATVLESVHEYEPGADEELRLEYNLVTPGFFAALGLPITAGRVFEAADSIEGGPRPMLINEDMAQRWWADRNPVEGTVSFSGGETTGRVLGVAANTKWDDGMLTPAYPFAYMPLTGRTTSRRAITLLVRTSAPEAVMGTLRETLVGIDPEIPILGVSTFGTLRGDVLMPQRMGATLLGAFAGLALLSSAVGIYGVVRHTVSQRTRELGIRVALGADRRSIIRLVAGGITLPLAGGAAVGLVGTLMLSGSVRAFLYGVRPGNPAAFAAVIVVLAGVTSIAAWLPARRAARVDPVRALAQD